jgi:hypothetical protein
MQNYVNQLIQDLAAAKDNIPPPVNYALLYPDHPALDFGMDYIVEWEMAKEQSYADLFGIKAEQLPPDDRLTDEQIEQILNAINDLFYAYNIGTNENRSAPRRLFYNEPIQHVTEGMITIEFCNCDPEGCIWGEEYCTCKDLEYTPYDFSAKHHPFDNKEDYLKTLTRRDDGSIVWVNPKFLDRDGNFNEPSDLPF